jgi:pimeloyl-ACP methyl ester carboxylesterase
MSSEYGLRTTVIIAIENIFLRTKKNPGAKGDIWFIHGFGDSGQCFKEVFSSGLARRFNIFVPDLPGFGASPFKKPASVKYYSDLLVRTEILAEIERSLGSIDKSMREYEFKTAIDVMMLLPLTVTTISKQTPPGNS